MLSKWFEKCLSLSSKYTHTEIGGSYYVETEEDNLYIYFQWSNGLTDWIFNFLFPRKKMKPYSDMGEPWECHGGFFKVWESIKPHLVEIIKNTKCKNIKIIGYSHGGGIAVLCHEYVWYNRPDLRDNLEGYGFGCPRVFAGKLTESLAERWNTFTVVRNLDDLVTHVPPRIFGFGHVGKLLEIGEKGKYNCIDAHRQKSYLTELAKKEGIIMPILAMIMTIVSYYFYIKGKALEVVSTAINKTEPLEKIEGKTSEDKLKEAVDQVYSLIPISAKVFIPESVVRFIVQNAFYNIEEYAKKQAKKYSANK